MMAPRSELKPEERSHHPVLRTGCVRPTLREALLSAEMLVMPAQLVAVDRLIEDRRVLEPFRAFFDPSFGRTVVRRSRWRPTCG